ncbi:Uma2 family endonuclease [Roseiflexus sp.]|uniref:Uma2 family endonuclease n=1 Tax=Roseiflexus sp. TaxID=2562120 RepID=UPI00398BB2BA
MNSDTKTTPCTGASVLPDTRPPLQSGDRLTRAEFARRYRLHPELKKAELIDGVVYVASPVRHRQHGRPHSLLVGWIVAYAAKTPGVDFSDNATVLLDFENEHQPDALLRLEPHHGGRSRISGDDYIEGPPDLIVEIVASSAAYDLHDKKRVYARSGVREYLVAQAYEQRVDWWELCEGVLVPLPPEADGTLRSRIFPGLWLNPAALWAGDAATLLATLQQGLADPTHAAFVERLRTTADEGTAR